MSSDPTEMIRREMVADINSKATSRAALESKHGQVWTTSEMTDDFNVLGFLAPFVIVQRRSDGVKGSLTFQHDPRFYYNFEADR